MQDQSVVINFFPLSVRKCFYVLSIVVGLVVVIALGADAQSTSFTYQGRLQDGGAPANGSYDFQFRLFDAPAAGSQVASTLVREDVTAVNGTFSVALDFGAAAFP